MIGLPEHRWRVVGDNGGEEYSKRRGLYEGGGGGQEVAGEIEEAADAALRAGCSKQVLNRTLRFCFPMFVPIDPTDEIHFLKASQPLIDVYNTHDLIGHRLRSTRSANAMKRA